MKNLPNLLTILRLFLAGALFAILSAHRFPDANTWALPAALVLFIVAALTDALDGYLARRFDAISIFGRIMDPFADKVLVLGAFIMLAAPNFSLNGTPVTGVQPWMVIVILARELLVTSLRGALESKGVDFSATLSGKLKMIAQSIGVPTILALLVWAAYTSRDAIPQWVPTANAAIAWTITTLTALSAIPYITRAARAARTIGHA